MHISTKTYGHNLGLSACFRQHRAQSHCHLLHGYALAVRFEFGADSLDENNWVVDFGALKPLKKKLEEMFDHALLVAEDDPLKDELLNLERLGLARIVLVPATGCEAFARLIYEITERWLALMHPGDRVRLLRVEVSEHGANSAIYKPTTHN